MAAMYLGGGNPEDGVKVLEMGLGLGQARPIKANPLLKDSQDFQTFSDNVLTQGKSLEEICG